MKKEQKIIDSWKANAGNWIDIIERDGIESRKLATNKAILEAIEKINPDTVLDIGCGEGWLSKRLFDQGKKIMGVDVIPELIDKAKQKVTGDFWVASYEDLANGKIRFPLLADAIVINFALLGKESTENLLAVLPGMLAPGGKLFIQTVHPHYRKEINDYFTGWKEGSWDGLGEKFTQPYQWYFRTMEDWLDLLDRSGFGITEVTEVLHPQTAQPLSVIFMCGVK